MSEKVWLYLIVAIAVLLLVLILRRRLSRLFFKGAGIETGLETHAPVGTPDGGANRSAVRSKGIRIFKNWQIGKGNKIQVGRADASVEENRQLGVDQEIVAESDETGKK